MAEQQEKLVEVENLVTYFPIFSGVLQKKTGEVKAVDDISFFIRKGETLGLVGESGCGKTTTGRSILKLEEPTSGSVIFDGKNLIEMEGEELRRMRSQMQPIFQDPFASLNPRMNVGDIIGEPLEVHNLAKGKELTDKVNDLLEKVGLAPEMAERYPHEFSGGQRQRIGIARALSASPSFIVCDEAVSALDVSIQGQIIKLLIKLREELNLTYLFISHDLSVVRHISDRVAVMYLGKIVEITTSDQIYSNPKHPYTISLLSAVPIPDPAVDRTRKRIMLKGDVPSPINPPSGCPFHTRCQMAVETCSSLDQKLRNMGEEHWVACDQV
ncbi:MAG: ATP-binding cassette domain-containing protein [SAR324 cluster bacterium]|jgi:oligopeptide transport system ATP-binding protein|nr:ATP-binding cassette domain-containing protein [SAR324 cluster bacterium]